jgi:ABC-type uncharacterized transport system involved in gliding motility auxiliary subunit
VVLAGLAVAAAVAVGWAGQRWHVLVDLNQDRTLTLTARTKAVLAALDGRLEATVFLRRDDPARVEALSLLSRYRREHRRLSYEALDPDEAPGEVRRLGVDPVFGGIAVRRGDRLEVAATPTEQDLTSALAELVRPAERTLCWFEGHGERSRSAAQAGGLGAAADLLADNGYLHLDIDLLAGATVTNRCDAAVLAAPTAPLGDETAATLRRWLADGGRLLALTDPAALPDPALGDVLRPFGLGSQPGLVLEGDPQSVAPGDPTAPFIRTFAGSHPITQRLAPVFLPGVQGVTVADDDPAEGLTLTRLADTTPLAYLETDPLSPAFDEADDVPGPITVAAAADRSRVTPDGRVERSRLVVIGDVDFATNPLVGEGANGQLLVRAVDWLAGRDDEVVLSTHLPRDRPLRLTSARVAYARVLFAGVIPALFALAGALTWAGRRGR